MLAARVSGEGPPVVLLHGQPGDGADWAAVARLLEPDHTVIAPDRPGYGRTGGRAMGFRANAGAVVDLVDHLGHWPAVVAGYSWGGGVALALAQHHPELVSGLVLLASVSPGQPLGPVDRALAIAPIGGSVAAASLWLGSQALSLPVVRQAVERQLRGTTDEGLAAMAAAWRRGGVWRSFVIEQRALVDELPGLGRRLSAIAVPTSVIVGGADRIVPPRTGRWLADSIPGSELVRLEGAGHLLLHEHPAAVAAEIRRVAVAPQR